MGGYSSFLRRVCNGVPDTIGGTRRLIVGPPSARKKSHRIKGRLKGYGYIDVSVLPFAWRFRHESEARTVKFPQPSPLLFIG